MTRKSDIVNFFNAHGVSILTDKHQGERIIELEAEVEHLKRLLKASQRKNSLITETANSAIQTIH